MPGIPAYLKVPKGWFSTGTSHPLLTQRKCTGYGNSILRSMLFNYLVINPLRTALHKHCAIFIALGGEETAVY